MTEKLTDLMAGQGRPWPFPYIELSERSGFLGGEVPKLKKEIPEFCYGCQHLTGDYDGAGGLLYKCKLRPGLVVGEIAHWIYDPPKACARYE